MKGAKVEKVYPIEGRTDFFKYVIMDNGKIATDFENKEMYFDEFDLERATTVCKAINKTKKINKRWTTT